MSNKDDYQEYKAALNELKMNSKPLINVLTILAEDKISNAPQVVRAIEERIVETRGEAVLHVLQLFEPKLAGLFAGAFSRVDERTRLAMFKLRQTWAPYFSNASLHNLDTKTNYIDPAWPITARVSESIVSTATTSSSSTITTTTATTTTNINHNSSSSQRTSEEIDRPVNRTRDDSYHMIPIERSRTDVDHSIEKLGDNELHSKNKTMTNRKESIPVSATINEEKKPTKISDEPERKSVSFNLTPMDNDVDNLFSGRDVDYRDTENPSQMKSNQTTSVDSDSIFELNTKCFSLAEEKYKSKELSTEEYQATLKLIQAILKNEAQRLTSSTPVPSSFVANNNHPNNLTTNNSLAALGSNPNANPFSNAAFLPFASNTSSATSTAPFSLADFANETQRHAMQILALATATVPYQSQYNLVHYLPPIPPAPSFPLLTSSFPSQSAQSTVTQQTASTSNMTTSGSSSNLFTGRHSPPRKRPHDDNGDEKKPNGDDTKRARDDLTAAHFDDETIAPVPSLVDANINTLKKKYLGVIQQLYVGKNQCHWCGLRFTGKQKNDFHQHLDWHFRENQKVSAAAARSQLSRRWYPSLAEWTVYEEVDAERFLYQQIPSNRKGSTKDNDGKQFLSASNCSSSKTISCPAKSNGDVDDDRCFVCRDHFESFFDDNKEEWHLKDAIRVDGKIFHPICYNDSKDTMEERKAFSLDNSRSSINETIENSSNNQHGDSQTVETAMATAKIKSDHEDSFDDQDSSSNKSSKPTYQSSLSFVSLIDTIYVKKEDLKPIENLENVSTTIKEEILDSTSMSEEIPFLSIKRETEC